MAQQERLDTPPLSHRIPSAITIGAVSFLCRTFLYVFSSTTTNNVETLLETLDARRDWRRRERGLLTVSNHLSVLDDPMIWGVLPFNYAWNTHTMRWSLGSYDICFKNGQSGLLSKFFTWGNTLPTQRLAHSPHGGLFQPTMTECIRLLSDPQKHPNDDSQPHLTFSTNSHDEFPSPSAYTSRRYSWLHIFPEGMIHQHPGKVMRYFKWGVARLILEAEPCPDVLPMWIDGPQEVMNEKRTWPRPFPRPGKTVEISFGELVNREKVLEPLRGKWRNLRLRVERRREAEAAAAWREGWVVEESRGDVPREQLGETLDDELRYGDEAQRLRIEVTMAVRNEVLKVRKSRDLTDEDPKRGLAETFRREGPKREGEMADQSIVRDM